MDSDNKTVDINVKSNVKRLPPLVLPKVEKGFHSDEFKTSLKYFTATSNAFKWDQTNINSNTKKFLARNGFNSLFWSALIIDDSILLLVIEFFGNNLKLITDEEFEPTFGIPLNKSQDISSGQLFANYFLLFTLPAKSHTKYLYEWIKRRLDCFYKMIQIKEKPDFNPHPELFDSTKRRFYIYKDLVPVLTVYAINSSMGQFANPSTIIPEMFRQIIFAISYSGLQAFKMSWDYSKMSDTYKVFELNEIKEDVKRITDARNTIINTYGEVMLPFARLLNYPEVELLDRRHYPDLAFCAHFYYNKLGTHQSLSNITFRKIKTKISTDQLKRLAKDMHPLSKIFPLLFDKFLE